jgi:oligoendopeptidase F
MELALKNMPEVDFQAFRQFPKLRHVVFELELLRAKAPEALSLSEEKLLLSLTYSGHEAWATLYDNLSSASTVCIKDPQTGTEIDMSLAAAAGLLTDPVEETRYQANEAMKEARKTHEITYASILNSLVDWRIKITQVRSQSAGRSISWLEPSLFGSRIQKATLDAMMQVLTDHRGRIQHLLQWKAEKLGKARLDDWDLMAPFPRKEPQKLSFAEGIHLIKEAFHKVDPSMADFVTMMVDKGWIEAANGPHKSPGAYCTKFLKTREPRVFLTYNGSFSSVKTLAHELGHAFHSWTMRDLPYAELGYPMTLAETASVFCESILTEFLAKRAQAGEEQELIRWTYVGLAEVFLLNIPARYDFECSMYKRRESTLLMPSDLCQMTEAAFQKWYGPALGACNSYFWANKLHFFLSRISFYNYPYTFGYLFAQGILQMRSQWGGQFFTKYCDLLRDTGRMQAEDLAKKHLGVDLTKPHFWQAGLEQVCKFAQGQAGNT